MGKSVKTVYLNIGCGRDYRNPKSGWVNIDNQEMYQGAFKVDLKADFTTLKWEDGTVDGILANHIIQYVPPTLMEVLLKRWYGWLRPGAEITFEAGNIIAVCQNILRAKTFEELNGKDGIMQLYGIDNHIWNKWAWCPDMMAMMMNDVGFKNLRVTPGYYHHNPERDFTITGTK